METLGEEVTVGAEGGVLFLLMAETANSSHG